MCLHVPFDLTSLRKATFPVRRAGTALPVANITTGRVLGHGLDMGCVDVLEEILRATEYPAADGIGHWIVPQTSVFPSPGPS